MFKNLSIKWKILLIAALGPFFVALVIGIVESNATRQTHIDAIVGKSKAIVLMAEAGREKMAQKLESGVVRPLDQLPPDKIIEAIPVITAIQMAEMNARKAGYTFRVPKFQPRNPRNEPTPEEAAILREIAANNLDEKTVITDDAVIYYSSIKLTRECMTCHGDPKGERDIVGGIKEGWKVGERHGAFVLRYSLDAAKAEILAAEIRIVGIASGIVVLCVLLGWIISRRGIIVPLADVRGYAEQVAEGKLDAACQGDYGAEVGSLKGSIESMVGTLKGKMREAEQKSVEATRAKGEAEAALIQAREQEAKVTRLLEKLTRIARDAGSVANNVSAAADELSAQVEQVTRGADVQSQRTAETATAMEEMNATVLEVARNSGSAAESAENANTKAKDGALVVEQAVASIQRVNEQARQLMQEMQSLGQQAEGIGRIITVIEDIADQTNLLALNAAIEAARAGDAGRGFAVVADEVRKLAEKTMDATKEVGQAIQAIQLGARRSIQGVEAAGQAVTEATGLAGQSGQALKEIVTFVNGTTDQVRSIATAAEQQSAASEEINRAVEDISQITAETSQGMLRSSRAVEELARQAQRLKELIEEMQAES